MTNILTCDFCNRPMQTWKYKVDKPTGRYGSPNKEDMCEDCYQRAKRVKEEYKH